MHMIFLMNMVESITKSLLESNLISSHRKDSLQDVKKLWKDWFEERTQFVNRIDQLTKVNLDLHWKFLIKQHSHWLVLKALTNAYIQMMPSLKASIFDCQVHIKPRSSPEFSSLLEIQRQWQQTIGSTSSDWDYCNYLPFCDSCYDLVKYL